MVNVLIKFKKNNIEGVKHFKDQPVHSMQLERMINFSAESQEILKGAQIMEVNQRTLWWRVGLDQHMELKFKEVLIMVVDLIPLGLN